MTDTQPPKARYIMIGGFLGAGKSTAIVRLAQQLITQGNSVGLITNDQSVGLVDTAMARSHGLAVEEIAGGCFCCRFDSLVEAARRLSRQSRPDVFIAEPVGSCTDLVASVSYPLRRIYGDDFAIAPLSVMLDPLRALRMLGVEEGRSFSHKVRYIYLKQLEEAQIIVVNKVDLLDGPRQAALVAALRDQFAQARVLTVSARLGTGLEPWLQQIMSTDMAPGVAMELDYDVYAEGEALLGWLNATLEVAGSEAFDGEPIMLDLATDMHKRINDAGYEIAHLKMTLARHGGAGDVAVLNLVDNQFVPELAQSLLDRLHRGQLIINLRAEADPEFLRQVTLDALAARVASEPGLTVKMEHLEHFRPAKPQPTHRMDRWDPIQTP